ncbi:rho GTPase activation protein, PH domain-like protein [Artemisia annua]|uniref:Rho GTPase activation protein, PH domain-like protein n=1 Tax=Artemisia annua TaxID=35608 RepID=A0A2U1QB89_ARTAN|nr:rho GTPase activation protein, PH domain-like protein [Artemisia annua]
MPNSKPNMVESKNNNINTGDSTTNTSSAKHNNACDLKPNNSAKDSNLNADPPAQGDGGGTLSPHTEDQPSEYQHSLNGNKVYKSGPLFLSSKGIGWTSWKKRWFVLTQTSLVFFRSDPNAATQRGGEVNLTLGGIDLNSSGSVVVKADKKLLTVSFPDGRDGKSFTLKAETTEDLNEWKAALEEALPNAPTASQTVGQSCTLKNDKADTADGSSERSKDRSPGKGMVLGRPLLFALEDIDGTPSFLEKALTYVEDHGVKVEGILRQAADVEDVERRIREYEQGKVEFTEAEDAHVIGDCIKFVLRELPSSPVPASCCNALLDAYRTDRATRVNAIRTAICDTFPEPNRRLLERMLIMMEAVSDNKTVNRMSVSAVAACMAPLLLRPLLAGECNLDGQYNMGGGDGSAQLMQAAAAANHAQAIVITLLEEYDNIFGEGDMLSDLYSDSEDLGSESEELSEDEIYEEDEFDDGEYTSEGSNGDEASEHASASSHSGNNIANTYPTSTKGLVTLRSCTISHKVSNEASRKLKSSCHIRSVSQFAGTFSDQSNNDLQKELENFGRSESDNVQSKTSKQLTDSIQISSTTADGATNIQHTDAKKDSSKVDKQEDNVKRPEPTEDELKAKAEEEELLNKKKALEARRHQLEQDVARLEEQLRKELELRRKLETGIIISQQALFSRFSTNEKDIHTSNDGNAKNEFHLDSTKSLPQQHLDPTSSFKETHSCKDNEEKHNFQSQSAKLPPTQHSDSIKDMKKSSSTKPKRLNSRNETAGAMSKITNGLNFLKERSNQLADELQSMNRDRNKSQSQRHARKGSQEFDFQSSTRPNESQLQHLNSQMDREKRSDDQSTNVESQK